MGDRCILISMSEDEGRSWPIQRCLEIDPNIGGSDANRSGGYSSLTKTADFELASLHEIGSEANDNFSIVFKKFNLAWILNGIPEPVD